MSMLFEQTQINGMSLSNRFVRSATWEGMAAEDGSVTGKLGPSRAGIGSAEQEAYFREEARGFKEEIEIPLILVGGMRSFEVAEELVEEGVTDYISLCRPFIREPDLIRRWKNGDRRKALCKSGNMCFKPAMKGHGIYCETKELEKGDIEK